eukprot:687499-Pelagomonas_calceolata.AAC.1
MSEADLWGPSEICFMSKGNVSIRGVFRREAESSCMGCDSRFGRQQKEPLRGGSAPPACHGMKQECLRHCTPHGFTGPQGQRCLLFGHKKRKEKEKKNYVGSETLPTSIKERGPHWCIERVTTPPRSSD